MLAAFRENGGEGKPAALQVHLSWAEDDETALDIAYDQWRTNVFAPPVCWDLETVAHFDEIARRVRREDLHEGVNVSADLARHVAWLEGYAELGFDEIHLHHVGRELAPFVEAFGEHVLPALGATSRS